MRLCRQSTTTKLGRLTKPANGLKWKIFWIAWTTLANVDLIQARHRTESLIDMGFGIADAAHLAFAEQLAEVFITCDDKLLKRCAQTTLRIIAVNPLEFIAKE